MWISVQNKPWVKITTVWPDDYRAAKWEELDQAPLHFLINSMWVTVWSTHKVWMDTHSCSWVITREDEQPCYKIPVALERKSWLQGCPRCFRQQSPVLTQVQFLACVMLLIIPATVWTCRSHTQSRFKQPNSWSRGAAFWVTCIKGLNTNPIVHFWIT